MLKRLLNVFWLCLVAVLFLSAVMLTTARLLVPSLGEYRNDIVAAVSTALKRPVTIRRLEATWRGLSPVLKLRGVTIGSARDLNKLDISEIWISIDVRHFLAEREVRLAGIDVIGVDLTLARDDQGRIYVEELPEDRGGESGGGDFSTMSRLSLHDASITLRDLSGMREPQRFSDVTLSLVNRGSRHELSGYALPQGSFGERVEVAAQLHGESPNPLEWRGVAYFRGKGLVMSTLLQELLPEILIANGRTDMRLWAQLDAGRLASLTGEIEVEDVTAQYGTGKDETRFDADRLQSQFGWRHTADGWQFALQDLHFQREERSWAADNLSVAAATGKHASHVRASASRLDLEVLGRLLVVLPIEERYRLQLLTLQPTGLLQDLSVSLRHGEETTMLDHFDARFIKLGVAQAGVIPAFSGLDGAISGSAVEGTLTLDSHVVELRDTRLFREALHFDRVEGSLHWHDSGAGIELNSQALRIGNDHLALQGDFDMTFPHDDAAPSMDLQLAVRRFDVARVSDYLPAKVMSPAGVAWLDRSLTGGMVNDGAVIIQGRLDQLPFDHGEGKLEVRLPVTGATLDFNKHWSPVRQLDAQVDFTGRQMDIRSHAGVMRSAALHDVHAQIKDLAKPRLTIKGDVRGDLPVMLAELGSSPLGETYGGFVDRVVTTGKAGLGLDIVVPLGSSPDPVTVAGRIGLQGNTLRFRDRDIELRKIRGQLDFDSEGIYGDGLQATLFDRPAQAKVWTESGESMTHIELRGKLALFEQALAEDHPLRKAITDNSDWQARLTIRGKPARGKPADVAVSVQSTLAGTAIDLPAPLGKSRDSVRKLSVRADSLAQREQQLQFSYADALQGLLVIEQEQQATRLQRGVIALEGTEPVLPDSESLLITGQLETFRLADWQPYFPDQGNTPGPPLRLSVGIGELELLGHRLRDAVLDIETAGRMWTIMGRAPSVEGEIRLTQSADGLDTVVMDLQRLELERVADAGVQQQQPPLSPGDMPDLQVTTQQLVYNSVNFGSLDLLAQQQPGGILDISRLAISSDRLTLRLTGDWRAQGDTSLTRVDLAVSDCRVDWLLEALGYQKLIEDGDLTGNLQASWPGAPWSFEPGSIDGKLKVIIKNGQILDVEPGAGRVLGLLSVAMLPKRLTLDFSDLFGEGFGFNRIGGSFVLDSGDAYTNDLEIDGPAAKIDISGRVGLIAKDYDELVTVTPYLQSSLPLAGAIAGGPAVGAAVIVAEKLLGEAFGLNEIARKQYAVTGPWAEPLVTRLEIPQADTGQAEETTNLDE
jgi:uncharacterized protein (TIGR02099 family)